MLARGFGFLEDREAVVLEMAIWSMDFCVIKTPGMEIITENLGCDGDVFFESLAVGGNSGAALVLPVLRCDPHGGHAFQEGTVAGEPLYRLLPVVEDCLVNESDQAITHAHEKTVFAEAIHELLFVFVRRLARHGQELEMLALNADEGPKEVAELFIVHIFRTCSTPGFICQFVDHAGQVELLPALAKLILADSFVLGNEVRCSADGAERFEIGRDEIPQCVELE